MTNDEIPSPKIGNKDLFIILTETGLSSIRHTSSTASEGRATEKHLKTSCLTSRRRDPAEASFSSSRIGSRPIAKSRAMTPDSPIR